jgi:hypothetical protein
MDTLSLAVSVSESQTGAGEHLLNQEEHHEKKFLMKNMLSSLRSMNSTNWTLVQQ